MFQSETVSRIRLQTVKFETKCRFGGGGEREEGGTGEDVEWGKGGGGDRVGERRGNGKVYQSTFQWLQNLSECIREQ